jgi:hypothetical protein
MSEQNLEEYVRKKLRELQKVTTKQMLKIVKPGYPAATLHSVRKILQEGGFAEQVVREVTVVRDGSSYERRAQVWVHKDQVQKLKEESNVPVVEVNILPRRPRPPYPVIERLEHKIPELVEAQDLEVTVKNATVRSLQVKVLLDDGGFWFNGKTPFYLYWGSSRALDFYANQTDNIIFWMAYKIGDVEKILLNLSPTNPIILPLSQIYQRKNPYIDAKVQFIGQGLRENPRDFRLNAQSWATLNLTDRSQP